MRLTVVMTHPVQYYAPWFRYIAAHCPAIDLIVLYATRPLPDQQGVGFGVGLEWDVALTEGYRCRIVREARPRDSVHSSKFWGLDVPAIARAVVETRPELILIPGWHSISLLRALWTGRRNGVPILYGGDTNLDSAPVGWRRPLWEIRTRFLLKLFDGYLSVGWKAYAYLRYFGIADSRIAWSPHCVDNDFFARSAAPHQTPNGRATIRESLGLQEGEFVVLFVGKFEPTKRPLDLIRAMTRLGGGTRLLMVGSGELEVACRAEAERLGVRVIFAGFLNQSKLGQAYAAADCLALVSGSESWGLVVNEALATGLPCVVSDGVGCAPDLITPGKTGEVFKTGDINALGRALSEVRTRSQDGHQWAEACRERIADYSFDRATSGLVEACRMVVERRSRKIDHRKPTRVVACCGGMVVVSGLERMTFEVLRTLREYGAAVHCIVNSWENERIVALANGIGASWTTGYYWYAFDRHTRNPVKWARLLWDIVATSAGLLRDAWRFQATHILVPEFATALRNAPALLVLRFAGIPVVLRVANQPDPGSFYRRLWRRLLPPLVTRFVANSEFSAQRLEAMGVPVRKTVVIRNTVSRRFGHHRFDADIVALVASRRTVLSVGQIAPFKGTHLVVEATMMLLDAGEDVQVVIVGRLPTWPPDLKRYCQSLQNKAISPRAGGRIQFVGERENVLDIMRAAYVLAAPILQEETFGNVVLEAKSVGLPVVAFATGGLPELVEHGVTGYLCRDSTVSSLIEGLRYFLADPQRREKASIASLAALNSPDSDFQPAVFRQRWASLFKEMQRS